MHQPHDTETLADTPAGIVGELGDSARQIWLAGIGALARAQAEGSRLFEQLAEEGRGVAQSPADAKGAAARLEGLRQALDAAMERTRVRADETWDSVSRVFERRIRQSLRLMDVPTRQDLDLLGARIDALAMELRQRNAAESSAGPPPPAG
ncbi:poly(hydroxyalkanoate) granule-associated protein [Pseudoxanthomonas broegbernensis]|uniref:Poly(Hydroxyalkanoate) granule-associated protein n=1 Tax=Pseudoxanthomonas broegbernensis TaxID=83619 RepID=A0A7V8GPV7_9GAMM|nr:phasin family protein [Pseudoxanthomonas broegbernensis]KAF1688000.1 poly(hydroxyalkanoate) granule-associated protein [Pseudoxanthomonas broegbernensis]MBB6065017.1 poly(hydroxyalkanoate) granule-associated protein [Pseudoxanthomonas broegbernensis]